LAPLRVSGLEPFLTRPPVPSIAPEKVSRPSFRVRVPDPRLTVPAPAERTNALTVTIQREVLATVTTMLEGITLAAAQEVAVLSVRLPVPLLVVLDKMSGETFTVRLPLFQVIGLF